eukprot:TRINITY_DN85634_c0_g1_i1.p2 TRINITY_DN85634_c0_g1~~TRINITY_DN85634_c0_g1_i1.p2  ORF type:complete len:188 (+),score=25.49 TRINITY_DN85634_c0_g1_i1:100-663(+)
MSSVVQAVNALSAAGDNLTALQQAIERASFLDDKPGDDRQKLRAARTKLRKLQLQNGGNEQNLQAADTASNKKVSPYVKQEYDVGEFDKLIEKYDKLAWRMIQKPGGASVKPDDYYTLYGYHKQACEGNNESERPMWAEKGGLDFEGRAKWDAWKALHDTQQEQSKQSFVKLYYEMTPDNFYKDNRF